MKTAIAPDVIKAIRLSWMAFDLALDQEDLALALDILDGLDERARSLGLTSAFELPIRIESR